MLIAEAHMGMDEVADRLHARPARRRIAEQRPRDVHQPLGLAIAAASRNTKASCGKLGDFVLARIGRDHVGQAAIRHHGVGANVELAGWRDQAAAHVAERVHDSA